MARARLAREHAPISTSTLAHELYLNLREREGLAFGTREQFMAYSSRAMRSLLVDMARERLAKKRSAELLPLTLAEAIPDNAGTPEQILALDDALTRLAAVDERLMRVAEMRIMVGMEISDVAASLNLSEPTVKRDWQKAKAYLLTTLSGSA
jgi:RNA polymerase sigma factor (TIGR02999 family)